MTGSPSGPAPVQDSGTDPGADALLGRIQKIAVALGLAGAVAAFFAGGRDMAVSFMIGAILSLLTVKSWSRLAGSLGGAASVPAGASAVFLVLRYVLIGGAIYVIVNNLGVSPVPLIVGLLVSFAAVVLALLAGASSPGRTH